MHYSLNLGSRRFQHLSCFSSPRCVGLRRRTRPTTRRRYAIVVHGTSTLSTSYSLVEWKNDFHDKYVLERSLGHGSFGEVWLATERDTREKVAVKEMPKRRGRLSLEGTFKKVEKEIHVMRDLISCPTTVQLKGCYALANSYKIVMEYCSGLDLRDQLKQYGKVSEDIVAYVAVEILRILRHCHENGIVHGDVKSANFILKSQEGNPFASHDVTSLAPGWLKAIDFGCSQYVHDGCRISSRVGTPIFMAPEVFDRDYGFESDLWSLGVLLYQLVSGKFPFWNSPQEAVTSSFDDVMDKVHFTEADFDSEAFNKISPTCMDFLKRLLEKNYMTRMNVQEAWEHPFITYFVKYSHPTTHGDAVTETDLFKNNNIVPAGVGYLNTTPTPMLD